MSDGASLTRQVVLIGSRSAMRVLRTRTMIMPSMVFPLMLLAINSAGLEKAASIPGFPADSYFEFLLVVTFMQGSLFATMVAGLGLGQDIESGFINRLALTPMRGAALILGQLGGALALGLTASAVYIAVGFAFGAEFQSGPLGVALLWCLAGATSIAFAALGAFLALRAGSGEAVQGLFPLLFASLFLSTLFMPLELIEADWFHTIARFNPVSTMVEGMRSLVIEGWNTRKLLLDIGVLVLVLTGALYGCSVALKERLTRT